MLISSDRQDYYFYFATIAISRAMIPWVALGAILA